MESTCFVFILFVFYLICEVVCELWKNMECVVVFLIVEFLYGFGELLL